MNDEQLLKFEELLDKYRSTPEWAAQIRAYERKTRIDRPFRRIVRHIRPRYVADVVEVFWSTLLWSPRSLKYEMRDVFIRNIYCRPSEQS